MVARADCRPKTGMSKLTVAAPVVVAVVLASWPLRSISTTTLRRRSYRLGSVASIMPSTRVLVLTRAQFAIAGLLFSRSRVSCSRCLSASARSRRRSARSSLSICSFLSSITMLATLIAKRSISNSACIPSIVLAAANRLTNRVPASSARALTSASRSSLSNCNCLIFASLLAMKITPPKRNLGPQARLLGEIVFDSADHRSTGCPL